MTNQEAKKILQRDLAILIENKSLPDGIEAMKVAISALCAIEQFRWERDVAIGQLREIGLELGLKTDEVQKAISVYKRLPGAIEELKKEVYRIDDSATLSSRDVINEEDVFETLESLLR